MNAKTKIVIARSKVVVGKLFIWSLGVAFGASVVFVSLEAPKLLEPQKLSFERVTVVEVAQAKVETPEETIKRLVSEEMGEQMVKVAKCESSLNPKAKNSESSARGLWQILDMHGLSEAERYDVEISTKKALELVEESGLKPWSESKGCWSK